MIAQALTIYNNAISANRWEYSDPKDAKIIALATKVEHLEAQMKFSANATEQKPQFKRNYDGASVANNSKYLTIDAWRMKKTEPMIQKEGKTWYWCPKHVSTGKYEILYVTHKPEDHEEWAKNRNRFKRREKKDDDTKESSKDNSTLKENEKSLTLSNSLKAALLTRCDLSAAQADALIKEARMEADF